MENPFEKNQADQVQRPTLLTVLCILTFIGSGLALFGGISGLLQPAPPVDQLEQSMDAVEQLGDSAGASILSDFLNISQETLLYIKEISGLNIVLSLLSLFGAFCMFRLRKIGFHLYSGAQILMLFVTPAFIGFGGGVMLMLTFNAVLALLFIVLYGLNLKYMK